jgi:hypothetical protein
MRLLISHFLIFSVLFMSIEGLWDMANETHPHSDVYAHQVDANHSTATDSDPLSEDCADHCQNICHGHLSSIAANNTVVTLLTSNIYLTVDASHFPALSQAPPTPPPNA